MANFTVRLPEDVAADAEALARAEGKSLNKTVKTALVGAVERRRRDPEFKKTLAKIIDQDRELLERLARRASDTWHSTTTWSSPSR